MITLIILIIITVIIFLWQISNFISIFAGSVYVAARYDLILFALKKAKLRYKQHFVDLGSGKGDAVILAQKLGAFSTGIEISPFYYFLSRYRTVKMPDINIRFADIRRVNLSKFDVVYCYLLPKFLAELSPKFLSEKPHKIISIGFEIKGLPNKKEYLYKNHRIFIYTFNNV